ncbi:MAG: hypothetical protein ACRBBW_20435 [Cellvibrionaceae bacterium]
MELILGLILAIIPRYVTDRVALAIDESGTLQVYCLEGQELEGDEMFIECYGTIKTFTWLGVTKGGLVTLDSDYNPQ